MMVEIKGEDDVLDSLISLFAKIQILGESGSSRTIPLGIDGDGAGRLEFKCMISERDAVAEWIKANGQEWEDDEIHGMEEPKAHWIGI